VALHHRTPALGQDLFRTRFTAIHTLIVNNFGEPEETPEHNALQALFLDQAFLERFLKRVGRDRDQGLTPRFELERFDVVLATTDWGYKRFYVECKPSVGDDYPAILRQMTAARKAGRERWFS
jgi:hypothetical protein